MSTEQLVAEVIRILIPALPYLVKGIKIGGKKAAEKLGELGANLSFEQAQKLWSALKKGKRSRKFEVAAQELAQAPQDKDWKKMLTEELKILVKADPDLAKTLAAVLTADVPEQVVEASENKASEVVQSIKKKGKQTVKARKNTGLVVRQTIDGNE